MGTLGVKPEETGADRRMAQNHDLPMVLDGRTLKTEGPKVNSSSYISDAHKLVANMPRTVELISILQGDLILIHSVLHHFTSLKAKCQMGCFNGTHYDVLPTFLALNFTFEFLYICFCSFKLTFKIGFSVL